MDEAASSEGSRLYHVAVAANASTEMYSSA